MKLPNADHALVHMDKLTHYCLNTEHPRGRHKARVFAAALGLALGLTVSHAEDLRLALLDAVRTHNALPTRQTVYGHEYMADFTMTGPSGRARVRSAWIVRYSEDFPRLTSCYVL